MIDAPDYSRDFMRVPRSVWRALQHDEITLRVYLALYDRAAYRAGGRLISGRTVHLELGQAVFGRAELAAALKTTERRIRTAIEHLVDLGIIVVKTTDQATSRGTLVTLVGYSQIVEASGADRPADRPTDDQQTTSKRPANDQQTTTNEDLRSEKGKTEETGERVAHAQSTMPIQPSSWTRRLSWWQAMLDAHRRLREEKGIKPRTPDLPRSPAGIHERNLIACEKQLRDAGDDDESVDRKMRHVVLVAEAEAERPDVRHLDWFIPSMIWDPVRFARAVDTTIETARKGRVTPGHAAHTAQPRRSQLLVPDRPPSTPAKPI